MKNQTLLSKKTITNRKLLDERVKEALEQLPSGEGKAILNFWGSPGEGRTTLLEHLRELLSTDSIDVIVGMWDADIKLIDDLIVNIKAWLETHAHEIIKVIIVDNVRALLSDGSDNPHFVQFEHNLVAEIVNRNDILMIIASQHEIRQWHELLIRMRQASYLIPPLTREEFDKNALAKGMQPAKSFEITLGHPAPLEWIYENPKISIEEVDSQAVRYFLRELKEPIKEEARVLSLLLQFDEAVMERALQAAGLGNGKTYFDLLDSIRQMGFAGLLIHDSRTGVYRFTDPIVRRLLARGYRRNNPKNYQLIHNVISEYYCLAARRASFLQNYLCSAIYHLAWSTKLKGESAVDHCVAWVNNMLLVWKDADWEKSWQAWLQGQGEPGIVLELQELLDEDGYNKLSQVLKAEWRKRHEKANF